MIWGDDASVDVGGGAFSKTAVDMGSDDGLATPEEETDEHHEGDTVVPLNNDSPRGSSEGALVTLTEPLSVQGARTLGARVVQKCWWSAPSPTPAARLLPLS